MRILLLLILSCCTLQAQEVFLWVRSVSVLEAKLDAINQKLGYPNPATKTDRAIQYDLLTNGTNAVIRLDISAIYSPRLGRYVDWADKVKEELTEAQWGTDLCTNTTQLAGKPVARISRNLAKQIGHAALSDTAPTK